MAASLAIGASALGAEKYPRVAAHMIGNPHNYQEAGVQAQLAKFNLVMVNYWPGWEIAKGTTIGQVAANIKAKNPSSKFFVYVIPGGLSRSPAAWADIVTKLDSSNWWLYSSGGSGNAVSDSWPGYFTTNTTLFAPKDSNGDRYVDWYAKWLARKYYQPNPQIDGFYTDTVYWQPRDTGDWNRDGTADSPTNPTVSQWFRDGYKAYFDQLKAQLPADKLQIATSATGAIPMRC